MYLVLAADLMFWFWVWCLYLFWVIWLLGCLFWFWGGVVVLQADGGLLGLCLAVGFACLLCLIVCVSPDLGGLPSSCWL